jgi:Transposase DDE domain
MSGSESKGISYDSLVDYCGSYFGQIEDHRRSNASISLSDQLKSAYAMFALKYPSMLMLEKGRFKEEDGNLRHLFGIKKIPSDTTMRQTLDGLNPEQLHGLFSGIIQRVEANKKLSAYKVLNDYLLCAMDGVSFFDSTKIHCENCQQKKTRDGVVHYSHAMLCGVLIHPERQEVLPLGAEPINRQDGELKNDHELVAAKRLWSRLWDAYSEHKFLHTGDALFANAPMIRSIEEAGHAYLLNVKPDSHELLFAHYQHAEHRHAYQKKQYTTPDNEHIELEFCNDLPLNNSAGDVRVNFLIARVTKKGKTTTFTWVSNLKITAGNALALCRFGRSRWKIENETFNTLKNQGYHFEHNYGHGEKHLCNTLAILMMIAFLVDQIQQMTSKVFASVLKIVKTKARLWEDMRAVFKLVPCKSFKQLWDVLLAKHSLRRT